MRAFTYVLVVCVVGVAALLIGCSGGSERAPEAEGHTAMEADEHHGHQQHMAAEAGAVEIAQAVCPVMGLKINEKIHVNHEGRKVYLCCPMCIDKFKADPQKYLAKVDAELQAASGGQAR